MHFSKITLTSYKNYQSKSFDFTGRIVGICGQNGMGKTNLLDAINYLCFTKSYFSGTDPMNVHFGAEGFRLEGDLETDNPEETTHKIVCIYRSGGKKEFFLDNVPYEKFSHHIGKFPCVMIAPDDIEMIIGGSETRRKFIDTLISQLDPQYLQQLIIYNKVLLQRNSFLKNEAGKNTFNLSLLQVLDHQLIPPAEYIFTIRKKFFDQLFPLILDFYSTISGNKESIALQYQSQLHEGDFAESLITSRQRDRLLQRTNVGVHKDDLIFLLNEVAFKTIASQGQRKSLLFACKLAQFETLKRVKGFPPTLLLDDVFEKLDESRMDNLLNYVCRENRGQVFITDTHEDRLIDSLKQFHDEVQVINLV